MARKAQRPYTQVSSLVGRIGFSVSGNAWTDKSGTTHPAVPKTAGFVVEVAYDSESDKMYHALCNSAVAVQQTLKKYYWSNGRFPAQPGKVFKAQGDGSMDLPSTVFVDRLDAKARGEGLDTNEIERLKAIIAMAEAKLAGPASATEATVPVGTSIDQGMVPTAPKIEYKYDEAHLRRAKTDQLINLAETEEFEGIADMDREELITELALVEKEAA